jgi:predicted small lipoprotein YifL
VVGYAAMRDRRLGAVLLCAVAALAACGRKGPPLPPIIDVPETTTGLWAHQEQDEVVLTWKYPALTKSGRTLTDLQRVEVYRMEVPPGQEVMATGPNGVEMQRQLMLSRAALAARLEGDTLKAATRGENLQYREKLPQVEEGKAVATFWYAVRSVRHDRTASALSNVVTWQRKPIPPAVTGLKAVPQADGILLSWDEVKDVPGITYVAERRSVPDGSWDDLGMVVMEKNPQLDVTAKQGMTWQYRIRAAVDFASGPVSPVVEVDYKDIYPPPPPSNFVCLPEPGIVRLRWDASPEEGVTYRVFRRQGTEKWLHLTDQANVAEFDDPNPLPGGAEYEVRAVDAAGNESTPLDCKVGTGP